MQTVHVTPAPTATKPANVVDLIEWCDDEKGENADLELTSGLMLKECPTRVLVPAAGRPLPDTWGLTSVFDLAFVAVPADQNRRASHAAPIATTLQDQVHTIITREPGITRCRRQHYTEAPAWIEREQIRRAKQRPPRPSRKARTMGRKLAELVTDLAAAPALP